MARSADRFGCRECGATFARWSGRCSHCGAMNSVVELNKREVEQLSSQRGGASRATPLRTESLRDQVADEGAERAATGMPELDRVLGGGLAAGSVVLLGGEPGIGKSTLLAQVSGAIARQRRVVSITAEESVSQVRERCRRLGLGESSLELAASADADEIAATIGAAEPGSLVVVDSIQLLARSGVDGMPGGVAQVRACGALLAETAKANGVTLLLIGHVTKDGSLAGPRTLEHLVDVVLLFEGDRYLDLRTLRAVKNRHGSTHELGLFRMVATGLEEVPDPAGLFISDRAPDIAGSCVIPVMEGNRCLLVEVQALVNPTEAPQPQRRVSGCDPNRVAMILAVLSRRMHLPLGSHDVFVNATGGAAVKEPAADLAIALAVASSFRDEAVPADCCAIGEVGLGGELRPAPRYELRAAEARRLGFKRLIGPGPGKGRGRVKAGTLSEAMEAVWG